MIKIKTAKQAREATLEALASKAEKELCFVEDKIDQAIKAGMYNAHIEGFVLTDQTIDKLMDMGYEVECGDQYNQTFYSIIWQ